MEPKKDAPQALTEQEKKLLTMLRSLEYGELRVVVQAGRPVRVEEIGLEATARVASIKIIYERTGRSLCPVFDNFTFKKE